MNRFCIVVPTYNSLSTLPPAVESALAQRHDDFVVYVSDNASNDGSQAYLESLEHPRLKVGLWKECLPKTGNWNRAFTEAPSSEYFVMLHSDDVLDADTLHHLDRAIMANPGAALIFGNYHGLSLDGNTELPRKVWPFGYRVTSARFDRLQFLCNTVSVVGVTFRADAYRSIGGFPGNYNFMQDVEFFRLLALTGPVVYVPERFGLYRDTPMRPANRLNYAREFVEWSLENYTCLPKRLGKGILDSHVRRMRAALQRDLPELSEEYSEWLGRKNLPGDTVDYPAALAHKLYKLWCVLTSCLSR